MRSKIWTEIDEVAVDSNSRVNDQRNREVSTAKISTMMMILNAAIKMKMGEGASGYLVVLSVPREYVGFFFVLREANIYTSDSDR